jgi:hypothetical protein
VLKLVGEILLYKLVYLVLSGSSPTGNPPPIVTVAPLFVSKWIDYSNKYGFGFQLSDKSVGVLFNDSTRISFTPDRRSVPKVKSILI